MIDALSFQSLHKELHSRFPGELLDVGIEAGPFAQFQSISSSYCADQSFIQRDQCKTHLFRIWPSPCHECLLITFLAQNHTSIPHLSPRTKSIPNLSPWMKFTDSGSTYDMNNCIFQLGNHIVVMNMFPQLLFFDFAAFAAIVLHPTTTHTAKTCEVAHEHV